MANRDKEILTLLMNPSTKEQGFRLLIGDYQERLYYHVRRYVQGHDDADDILQNTLIKVWNNIGQFRGESGLFTWLYRIAGNEAITFLNREKRQRSLPSEGLYAERGSHDQPDPAWIQQRLEQAIAQLPEKQRQVFILRYYDELPYEEIAAITETSVGALKASYHHAAKKIEEFFTR